MARRPQRNYSHGGTNSKRKGGKGIVALRKDGTVYSQDRITVRRDGKPDEIVPTMQAYNSIVDNGWGLLKFRGPDGVERPLTISGGFH